MSLKRLDHVNIRTDHLETMVAFYTEVLGLVEGYRPPFPFPGAWLYCGHEPVVHLIGVPIQPRTNEPAIEHFAFRATELADFLARLRAEKIPYRIGTVPELGTRQVNVLDPDGNHLHVDFAPEEAHTDPSDYDIA